jgi:hypothetical protein
MSCDKDSTPLYWQAKKNSVVKMCLTTICCMDSLRMQCFNDYLISVPHTYSAFGKVFTPLDFLHILLQPYSKIDYFFSPYQSPHTMKYHIYISIQTLYSVFC